MSKKTRYSLGILLTILIGTYFYWELCCGDDISSNANKIKENVVQRNANNDSYSSTSTPKITGYPFVLRDPDGDFTLRSDDNFNFDSSGYNILRPVSEKVNSGIDELQLYLSANERKLVNISGMYTSAEENTSAFPNLGMARANSVKNYLITRGIPSSQMNLRGKLNENLKPDGMVFRGPVHFGISNAVATSEENNETELEVLQKRIQEDPLILNFANAQTRIDLTEAQRLKIAEIVRYLDLSKDGKALVTGHTDATGSSTSNVTIGQKRANFAKNYLVQNGILEARIEATSKGSAEPVGNNATQEGRAQNRRTVVTVN